jgi:ABC-type transporter Mla MlaB component
MWKLLKWTVGDFVILNLSGRLEGDELIHLRQVIASEARNRNIVLDLKGVRLVDQASVTFLARYEAEGAKLRNCPAYIREWITKGSCK